MSNSWDSGKGKQRKICKCGCPRKEHLPVGTPAGSLEYRKCCKCDCYRFRAKAKGEL